MGPRQRLGRQITLAQIYEDVPPGCRLRDILDLLKGTKTPCGARTAGKADGASCALSIVCASAMARCADMQAASACHDGSRRAHTAARGGGRGGEGVAGGQEAACDASLRPKVPSPTTLPPPPIACRGRL